MREGQHSGCGDGETPVGENQSLGQRGRALSCPLDPHEVLCSWGGWKWASRTFHRGISLGECFLVSGFHIKEQDRLCVQALPYSAAPLWSDHCCNVSCPDSSKGQEKQPLMNNLMFISLCLKKIILITNGTCSSWKTSDLSCHHQRLALGSGCPVRTLLPSRAAEPFPGSHLTCGSTQICSQISRALG